MAPGVLSPAFSAATLEYTAVLPLSAASFVVKADPATQSDPVFINGNLVSPGATSKPIFANTLVNIVPIVLQRQNCPDVKYTLTVSRGQSALIKAGAPGAQDFFGAAVAVSASTLVVGARGEDSNAKGMGGDPTNDGATESGAAYVFVRDGTSWKPQAYLKASNAESNDEFGTAVAISGDTIVVGAPLEDSSSAMPGQDNSVAQSGAAYVFVRTNGVWAQQAILKAGNPAPEDAFGAAVAIDGDTIVVGAFHEGSSATGVDGNQTIRAAAESGAAYVFTRSGTTWTRAAYLKASNTTTGDHFGAAVAIAGTTIAVGAPAEDSNAVTVGGLQLNEQGTDRGAVYVFLKGTTSWSQQAYLKASSAQLEAHFGASLALAGDTLAVGAPGEATDGVGLNPASTTTQRFDSGAVFVFTRATAAWTQQVFIKAPNAAAADLFGSAVALSGEVLVVGAPGESTSGLGVNGPDADRSSESSGAAYGYTRTAGTWAKTVYLKGSVNSPQRMLGESVSLAGATLAIGASGDSNGGKGVNPAVGAAPLLSSGAVQTFEW